MNQLSQLRQGKLDILNSKKRYLRAYNVGDKVVIYTRKTSINTSSKFNTLLVFMPLSTSLTA